jgi:chromosome segregation ATPase
MSLFKDVQRNIDSIYQLLSRQGDTSGSAVLYLENQEEPFAGGVVYSPTPARKTFVFDTEGQVNLHR